MIPKILHQIWVGGLALPSLCKDFQKNWKRLHPDWEYILWGDEDIPPTIRDLAIKGTTNASRSNVIRIYVMSKYGGVYADVDFDWHKCIDEFLKYDAIVAAQQPGIYNNAFFGAALGHSFIQWQLERLEEYVNKLPPWGPVLMTQAVNKHKSSVHILPTSYFYPYLWTEKHRRDEKFVDAYAVHHWMESWKGRRDRRIKNPKWRQEERGNKFND